MFIPDLLFSKVGAIHFANAETFRCTVDRHISSQPLDPHITGNDDSAKDASITSELRARTYGAVDSPNSSPLRRYHDLQESGAATPLPAYLIIDCSGLSFVDLTGSKALGTLHADLLKLDVALYLAGCTEPVLEQLDRCLYFHEFPKSHVYPTVIDAVLSIKRGEQFTVEPFDSSDIP